MSKGLLSDLRRDWMNGALAKKAFADLAPPDPDGWRDIGTAPSDDTPIWSINSAMREAVISRRGYEGHDHLWTILAEPFDKYAGAPGGMHCPSLWQPIRLRSAHG